MLDRTATLALWQWAEGRASVTRADALTLLKGAAAWSRFGVRDPTLLCDPEGNPVVAADGAYTLYFNGRNAPIDQGGLTRIGRAIGAPPGSWRIDPEPAFTDGAYAAQGSVVRVASDDYRLYYSFNTALGFAIARSRDGVKWARTAAAPILHPQQFEASLIGLPYVARHDNLWVMLFEGFAQGRAKLYMALSADGLVWQPGNDGNPVYIAEQTAWDTYGQANPSLVRLFSRTRPS